MIATTPRRVPDGRLTPAQDESIYRDVAEIPQRLSLVPGFPKPGRRGPSRVAAAQPGATPGQAQPPSIQEPPPPITGPDIYPEPRDRNGDDIVINSQVGGANTPGASAPAICTGAGGAHLQIGINLATGSSQVNVSERIDRPFKITHVEHYSDGTTSAKTQFRLKIASDNAATGGLNATGTNLDELNLGGDDFLGDGQVHHSYPNKVWRQLPAYIKFCHDNQTGVQKAFQTVVNIDYLD